MSHRILASLCCVSLSLGLLGTSCKSTGPDQAESTASSISDVELALKATGDQIATTNGALDQILANPKGDLRPGYDAFSKAVSELESRVKTAGNEVAAMKEKAQAYLANWEKNQAGIQSEELRESSEERRKDLAERQQQANERADAGKQRLDAYVTSMKDIHGYLGNDLTTAGVESIESNAKKTKKEGDEIREVLEKLSSRLAELRKSVSAQGPATPPPAS